MKVFVCDGDGKAALAITRSLGRKGIDVTVGTHRLTGRALFSKYCKQRVHYPDPHDEVAFFYFMEEFFHDNHYDVIIPVSYLTCRFFSKYKEGFSVYSHVPIADWDMMQVASDKSKTMGIADACGVPRPKTGSDVGFPKVVKSDTESTFLRFVNNPKEELEIDMVDKTTYEYIHGRGFGYFALFDHGKLVVDFQHMRIREYPITGGPATFAKSVFYSDLKQYGQRILEHLDWHGVAMCEFKRDDRDGKFKLIEINPKFWGSLDLSITNGVDFPYYLVQMAMGELKEVKVAGENKMFRWLFPWDFLALLANPGILLVWLDDLFVHRICRYSLDRSDWKPELFNILMTPYAVAMALKDGLRYPNGNPHHNLYNSLY